MYKVRIVTTQEIYTLYMSLDQVDSAKANIIVSSKSIAFMGKTLVNDKRKREIIVDCHQFISMDIMELYT